MVDISVVVPIYNNSQSLVELTERLLAVLNEYTFEIIYINDCSPDNSFAVIERLSIKYPQIKSKDLPINIGQHKATLEGIKMALGDKIVVMDGDLQDDPKLINALKACAFSDGEAAFVKRKGIYQSLPRMLTSLVTKKTVQLLSGLHYKAGSYYLFDKSIQPKVLALASFCSHPYMSIMIAQAARKVNYIEAQRGKSIGGSGYNFKKRLRAGFMAIHCSIYCLYFKLVLD